MSLSRSGKPNSCPQRLHSPVRDLHPEGDFVIPLRELLRFAVSESDGTASDVLLRVLGGAEKVESYLQALGITEVQVVTTESEMARDDRANIATGRRREAWSPCCKLLQEGRGLSPASRVYLLELMTKTSTGLKRIKGMLPAGALVAHKTGTSGSPSGFTAATNDVGLITLPGGKFSRSPCSFRIRGRTRACGKA